MSRNINNKNQSKHFFALAFLVIIVLPLGLLLLYEKLAGGALNGFMHSWRPAIVRPDIFLGVINPIVMLLAYIPMIFYFRKYAISHKSSFWAIVASSLVFLLATIITITIVFWKFITT